MNSLIQLQQSIQSAWQVRAHRSLSEFYALFQSIERESELCDPIPVQVTFEMLLLRASLARAGDRIQDSKKILSQAKSYATESRISLTAHFYSQQGLNFFVEGEHTQALDSFVRARDLYQNSLERADASVNILLCMENLGLPFETERKKLKGPFHRGAQSQLEALDNRTAFRRGDLSFLEKESPQVTLTQSSYFTCWVKKLAYHETPCHGLTGSPSRTNEILTGDPYFHKKQYRLRTLLGIADPIDELNSKPNLIIERLYLWTWSWLVNPKAFPLSRILELTQKIDFSWINYRLSPEDFQMLRNALTWLCLYDPASGMRMKTLISSLTVDQREDFPLLGYEYLVIQYLGAVQANEVICAQRTLKLIESHPLWHSQNIFLGDLVLDYSKKLSAQTSQRNRMGLMSRGLSQVIHSSISPDPGVLYVDLAKSELIWNEGKSKIVSRPICSALELLSRKKISV